MVVNYLGGAVEFVVVAAVVVGGGGAALFLPPVKLRGGVEQPDADEEEPCSKFGIDDLINFVYRYRSTPDVIRCFLLPQCKVRQKFRVGWN